MSSHKIVLLLVAFLAVQLAYSTRNVNNLRTNQKISIISENDQQSAGLVQLQDFIDNLRTSSNNKFNKLVLDTITLKIKSGDTYQSLIQLLTSLTNQLQTDQQADDLQYQTQSTFINGQITTTQNTLTQLQVDQVDLTTEQSNLQAQISDINDDIALIEDKLNKVNSFYDSLQNARVFDSNNFMLRQQEQNAIQIVIDQIITDLGNAIEQQINSGAADQSALIQLKNKMESLKALGTAKQDVISNMVQLTMTFDVSQVQQIVLLLNQIKIAINKSINQDANDETQAIADYNQMISEIESAQQSLQATLADLNVQLVNFEEQLQQVQQALIDNQTSQDNANTSLIQYQGQLVTLTNQYESDKAGRAETLSTVDQAQGKIGSIQTEIQSYS